MSAISHGSEGGECTDGLTFNTTYDNLNTAGNFQKERRRVINWKPIGIKKIERVCYLTEMSCTCLPTRGNIHGFLKGKRIMLIKLYFRVQRKGNECIYEPGNAGTRPAHCLHPYANGT